MGGWGGLEQPLETHMQRHAALYDLLPRSLGDGDTEIEIVYGEEKIFTQLTGAAKAG